MNNIVTNVMAWINTVTDGNEMLSATLLLVMSSIGTYILFRLPKQIYSAVVRQITITATVTDDMVSRHGYNKIINLIKDDILLQRTFRFTASRLSKMLLLPGFGNNMVRYQGKLMFCKVNQLISSGSEREKTELVMTVLRRNKHIFNTLLKEINPSDTPKDTISVFRSSQYDERNPWIFTSFITKTEKNKLLLNKDTLESVMGVYNRFVSTDCERLGIAKKKTIILHGKPGTSKTTTVRALAAMHGKEMYCLDLSTMSDSLLVAAFTSIKKGSIVVIEDIDTIASVLTREDSDMGYSSQITTVDSSRLTLAGILNAMDGIVALDDVMLIMTTNHLDRLDPALTRKGRTDAIIELKELNPETYVPYIESIYGDITLDIDKLKPIRTCDLFGAVEECGLDKTKLKNKLEHT